MTDDIGADERVGSSDDQPLVPLLTGGANGAAEQPAETPEELPAGEERGEADPESTDEREARGRMAIRALIVFIVIVLILLLCRCGGGSLTGTSTSGGGRSQTATTGTNALPPAEQFDREFEGPATVPDVIGMTRAAALAALADAGYTGSITEVYGTKKPPNTVIHQNPSGGAVLEQGGKVGLVLQLGPRRPTMPTPRLIGLSQAAAERRLRAAGLGIVLSYSPVRGREKPGFVRSQWPVPGKPVSTDGEVQIQIVVKP